MQYNVKINDKRQYGRFMQWLESNGYAWRTGSAPTEFNPDIELKAYGDKVHAIIIEDKRLAYIRAQDPMIGELKYMTPTEYKKVASQVGASSSNTESTVSSEPTSPRTFRLLKNSVELKKGALVQEISPEREYVVTSKDMIKYPEDCQRYFSPTSLIRYSRQTVETQTDYFEEVFPSNAYFNREELKKFNRWLNRSLKG
jgi:hypothetical protein